MRVLVDREPDRVVGHRARRATVIADALAVDHDLVVADTSGRDHASDLARTRRTRDSTWSWCLPVTARSTRPRRDSPAPPPRSHRCREGRPTCSRAHPRHRVRSRSTPARSPAPIAREPIDTACRARCGHERRRRRDASCSTSASGFDAAIVRRMEERHAHLKRYLAHPAFAVADRRHLVAALRPRHPHPRRSRGAARASTGRQSSRPDRTWCVELAIPYTYVGRRAVTIAPHASLDRALAVTVFSSLQSRLLVRAAASGLAPGAVSSPTTPRIAQVRRRAPRRPHVRPALPLAGRRRPPREHHPPRRVLRARRPHPRRPLSTSRATSGTSVISASTPAAASRTQLRRFVHGPDVHLEASLVCTLGDRAGHRARQRARRRGGRRGDRAPRPRRAGGRGRNRTRAPRSEGSDRGRARDRRTAGGTTRSAPGPRDPVRASSSTSNPLTRSSGSKPGRWGRFLISTFTRRPAQASSASASVGTSGRRSRTSARVRSGSSPAGPGGVVADDEHVVRGAVHVELHPVGAERHGPRRTLAPCSRALPGWRRGGRARASCPRMLRPGPSESVTQHHAGQIPGQPLAEVTRRLIRSRAAAVKRHRGVGCTRLTGTLQEGVP